MVKSLGKSVIKMYFIGACAVLGISNQDVLSEDLESDPFLNSPLQGFTCELYYRFGSLLAALSVGLITSRNYLSELGTKNGRTNQIETTDLRSEKLTTLSKYDALVSAMAAKLVIGFWFGIGFVLAVKMVNSLDYCI